MHFPPARRSRTPSGKNSMPAPLSAPRMALSVDPGRRSGRHDVARCVLPRLPDQPRNRRAHYRPLSDPPHRQPRIRPAVLLVPGFGADAEDHRAARVPAGGGSKCAVLKVHHDRRRQMMSSPRAGRPTMVHPVRDRRRRLPGRTGESFGRKKRAQEVF